MATKREPVLGKLINDGEYYGYATFYELKRNGQIKKQVKWHHILAIMLIHLKNALSYTIV